VREEGGKRHNPKRQEEYFPNKLLEFGVIQQGVKGIKMGVQENVLVKRLGRGTPLGKDESFQRRKPNCGPPKDLLGGSK